MGAPASSTNYVHLEDEGKLRHYERDVALGGHLALGTGTLVPFAITSGGLLAPSAKDLLKRFARDRSAPRARTARTTRCRHRAPTPGTAFS